MGLFGNDKEQDTRLDAIESFVRAMSEAVQQTQLDVAGLHILLMGVQAQLQAQINDKVSAEDFDPSIVALNEQLGVARAEYERMAAAASETWTNLHAGASDAVNTLRASVEEAAARINKELDT